MRGLSSIHFTRLIYGAAYGKSQHVLHHQGWLSPRGQSELITIDLATFRMLITSHMGTDSVEDAIGFDLLRTSSLCLALPAKTVLHWGSWWGLTTHPQYPEHVTCRISIGGCPVRFQSTCCIVISLILGDGHGEKKVLEMCTDWGTTALS